MAKELPVHIASTAGMRLANYDVADGFSAYVHIPFCKVRCGYCDFNTYTNPNFGVGASLADYQNSVHSEIVLSAQLLNAVTPTGKLKSVFFGGGTPTLLPVSALLEILHNLKNTFGFQENIEITTEANPDSVTYDSLVQLRDAGFTRISFGVQSAVPSVLQTLDRSHTKGQVEQVVAWAQELGLAYSLDLIYGAPGETLAQWQESLDFALALEPGHISCYALTIEPGTKMGAQLRRGLIPKTSSDDLADKYIFADEKLLLAGYNWYEISNWAKPGAQCQHNLYYWQNENWWGYGPGAHSHLNGMRFWNVKHPLAYAQKLVPLAGVPELPIVESEILSDLERDEEYIMLGIRLRQGISIPKWVSEETLTNLLTDGLLEASALKSGTLVLTCKGRLLADSVIRELWQ